LAACCNYSAAAQNALNSSEGLSDAQKEHVLDSLVYYNNANLNEEEAYKAFEHLKRDFGSTLSRRLQVKIDKSLFYLNRRFRYNNNIEQLRNSLFTLNNTCLKYEFIDIVADNYIHIAWFYRDEKNYVQMLIYYLKAFELIRNLTVNQYPSRDYSLYTIAEGFYAFNDYKKAIEIAKVSFEQQKEISTFTFSTTLIGMAYLKNLEYDSALVWFNAALNFSESKKDTTWIGISSGNIGNVMRLQNKSTEAMPFLQKGIAYANHGSVWTDVASFKIYLADIYVQQNRIADSYNLLEQARQLINATDNDNALKYFNVMVAYHRKIGNASKALQFLDSAKVLNDKYNKEFNGNLKVTAELYHERNKLKTEEELILTKASQQKWVRNFIIAALLGALAMLYLVYKRKQQKIGFEKQVLENKNTIAQLALADAKHQLLSFTNSLREKNEIIEKFTEEIEKLQALPCNIITPEQTHTLAQLKASAILTDKDWELFTQNFEKVHPGFLERLKLTLPDVSPAETRFLVLAKLNLSNKEMAAILGVTTEAIRTIKFRVRKKWQLDDDASIEDFLATI
jgi:tetratricopeptide (TPR) repeat protein